MIQQHLPAPCRGAVKRRFHRRRQTRRRVLFFFCRFTDGDIDVGARERAAENEKQQSTWPLVAGPTAQVRCSRLFCFVFVFNRPASLVIGAVQLPPEIQLDFAGL